MNRFVSLVLSAAVLSVLPLLAVARADEAPSQACQPEQLASLDMVTLADGRFDIPITFNGKTLPMLVDTGGRTGITGEAADELGVKRQFAMGGAYLNNVRITQQAKIAELKLGSLQAPKDSAVNVIPNSFAPVTAFGLVGPEFLLDDVVELDFYLGKFNVYNQGTCDGAFWTRAPYAALPIRFDVSHHILVQGTLDGKPVTVAFDTGSPGAIMSVDAARPLFGWALDEPRLKQIGLARFNGGAPTQVYTFPFGSLNFAGFAMPNPRIVLVPQQHFIGGTSADEATIILGMSTLRQLHIFIDYKNKMLYLTDAEPH